MKYIICFLLSLSYLSVWAQSENEKWYHQPWSYYVSAGTYPYHDQKLNDFLKENNTGQFENSTDYLSFGIAMELKRSSQLVVKGSILQDKLIKANTNYDYQIRGWGLGVDYNYNLIPKKNRNFLYASCGTGFYKRKMDLPIGIDGLSNGSSTFKTKVVFYSELGSIYEHKFSIWRFDLYAGIKALYHIPLGNKHWYNANDVIVRNFPNADSNGFKFGITSRIAINWDKFQR